MRVLLLLSRARWAQDLMYEICGGDRKCVEEVWRLCGGRYECVRAAKATFEAQAQGALPAGAGALCCPQGSPRTPRVAVSACVRPGPPAGCSTPRRAAGRRRRHRAYACRHFREA